MPPAPSWIFQPLAKHHDRAAFSCGNGSLDDYLKKTARRDASRKVAATFVLIYAADPKSILGYYTLSSSSINLGDLPEDVIRRLPRYPYVPVTLLGRLAVDRRQQGKGLGELLLMDALHRSLAQSSQIGAAAVVVDAIDEQAVRFYRHFHFVPFPDIPDRLFMPMKTIADLFPGS